MVPYRPVEGPDAWYGQQQRQQQQQWLHELTQPELEELDAAVQAVSRKLRLRIQDNYLVGVCTSCPDVKQCQQPRSRISCKYVVDLDPLPAHVCHLPQRTADLGFRSSPADKAAAALLIGLSPYHVNPP